MPPHSCISQPFGTTSLYTTRRYFSCIASRIARFRRWPWQDTQKALLPKLRYGVLSGIKRATVKSPAIWVKIWFRLVVGCEAEMQPLLPPVAV